MWKTLDGVTALAVNQPGGGNIMQWANEAMANAKSLILIAIGLVGVVIVAMAWVKKRSFVAVIAAALVAAFVLWVVNNLDFLKDQLDTELPDEPVAAEVATVGAVVA